jgi:glyoxylase-like metal-dependent hydrolase (beta-lactamase superfamily II)
VALRKCGAFFDCVRHFVLHECRDRKPHFVQDAYCFDKQTTRMKKLQKNVYLNVTSDGANIGCVAGDDAIILIDLPQDPLETSAWRDALRAEFGERPIRAIFFTSSDRLNSESLAVINATAMLHDAAYAQLAPPQEAQAMALPEPMTLPLIRELGSTPQLTFSQSASVVIGTKQPSFIDIAHQGGYSPDACFVIVREAGIVFAGDHVAIGQPPLLAQGNFEHWQSVLAGLKKMKQMTMVVPGRGPAGVPATAGDETLEFIKAATSRVKALVRSNRSRSDVGALVPELMAAYGKKSAKSNGNADAVQRYVRAGLERIYDDLKTGAAL